VRTLLAIEFRASRQFTVLSRILLPHPARRIRISAIEGTGVFWLRVCIPVAERLNECAFDRGGVRSVSFRQAEFLPSPLRGWQWDQRKIDVRSAGHGDGPMRHRAFGIRLSGLLK